MRVEVDLRLSVSMVNSATGLARFFQVTGPTQCMRNSTSMTRARPLDIGCNGTQRSTLAVLGAVLGYKVHSEKGQGVLFGYNYRRQNGKGI